MADNVQPIESTNCGIPDDAAYEHDLELTTAKDPDAVKLFVGQVPRNMTEESLRGIFSECGEISEISVIRDRVTDRHRGCAFVTYTTREAARNAIDAFHNKVVLPEAGNSLQVRPAEGQPCIPEHKLFIGMLPRAADESVVEGLFAPYGEIEELYVLRNPVNGQSKGCAFLKYVDKNVAQSAIDALNGQITVKGGTSPIVVKYADSRKRTSRRNPAHLPFGAGDSGHFGMQQQQRHMAMNHHPHHQQGGRGDQHLRASHSTNMSGGHFYGDYGAMHFVYAGMQQSAHQHQSGLHAHAHAGYVPHQHHQGLHPQHQPQHQAHTQAYSQPSYVYPPYGFAAPQHAMNANGLVGGYGFGYLPYNYAGVSTPIDMNAAAAAAVTAAAAINGGMPAGVVLPNVIAGVTVNTNGVPSGNATIIPSPSSANGAPVLVGGDVNAAVGVDVVAMSGEPGVAVWPTGQPAVMPDVGTAGDVMAAATAAGARPSVTAAASAAAAADDAQKAAEAVAAVVQAVAGAGATAVEGVTGVKLSSPAVPTAAAAGSDDAVVAALSGDLKHLALGGSGAAAGGRAVVGDGTTTVQDNGAASPLPAPAAVFVATAVAAAGNHGGAPVASVANATKAADGVCGDYAA